MPQPTNVRIPAVSTEFVRVQVSASKNGLTYNPTSDNVYFAYTALNVEPTGISSPPSGSVWTQGQWETVGSTYIACGLVGPIGGTVLAVGTYSIWVFISDNPETPVRNAGTLQVY
jgi:hypothetical protein